MKEEKISPNRGKEFSDLKKATDIIRFLETRGKSHTGYFHYTTLDKLKDILRSKKLYLSLGKNMNDLLEIQKCAPEKWNRLYVASFSFGANESMAMWSIYGEPFADVLRLKFSRKGINSVVENAKETGVFKPLEEQPFCKAGSIKLVDIAYLRPNSIRWDKATLYQTDCSEVDTLYCNQNMAGYLKNIAWEYENETRILVELSESIEKNEIPERIAIDISDLFQDAKILCGPCLDPQRVKNELGALRNESRDFGVIDFDANDKNVKSTSWRRVRFRNKCSTCEQKEFCYLDR